MSTRGLIHIYELNEGDSVPSVIAAGPFLSLYRQCDCYPSGLGVELGKYLAPFKIVNGMSGVCRFEQVANGAGCLAAQLVAHFKDSVGHVYIVKAGAKEAGQDYEYDVIVIVGKPVVVRVSRPTYPNGYDADPVRETLWEGPAAELATWAANRE